MARRLTGYVHVRDDAGDAKAFGPDDTVPAWAEKQITNPKAWEGEGDDESDEEIPEGDPSEDWKVDQLKAYAEREGVDLGGATKKADILTAVTRT